MTDTEVEKPDPQLPDGYVHRTSEHFEKILPAEISGKEHCCYGDPVETPPKPFFWHPVDEQPFGELQQAVIGHQRQCPEIAATYSRDADRGPRPIEKAPEPEARTPAEWSALIKQFAHANQSDLVGITPKRPEYVYEGYEIPFPNLILIGIAMDHPELATAPSNINDMRAAVEIASKYNQASRAARYLANFILAAGYNAKTFPGPMATALNMIPAAIAAGLGELGKHGSMINREYGSSFRLSAIATDMPLAADQPDIFGADDFCLSCQVCTKACPPDAIFSEKQTVRGAKKWYVDFDKCIPYFGEAFSCGICIAECPWSRPGIAPRLIDKLARRKARRES